MENWIRLMGSVLHVVERSIEHLSNKGTHGYTEGADRAGARRWRVGEHPGLQNESLGGELVPSR
jgi:hypothetical protein